MRLKQLFFIIATLLILSANGQSGGVLNENQASYDVLFYDLNIDIYPEAQAISGIVSCRAELISPIDTFELDLNMNFEIDSISVSLNNNPLQNIQYLHENKKVFIEIPAITTSGDIIETTVFYSGTPPENGGDNPYGGFIWNQSDENLIYVYCIFEGADSWWPCKDHPSDEADSVNMNFTVPEPLVVASNGVLKDSINNGEGTITYNWFNSSPISNWKVIFFAGNLKLIEQKYTSITGDTIPFKMWVNPSSYANALNALDMFKEEFDFLESINGPYPFGHEKHGIMQASGGMENQTIISIGNSFDTTIIYHGLHFHELSHEWWGNLVTAKNWADIWIHEGIASYTESLYLEHLLGYEHYLNGINSSFTGNYWITPLAPRQELEANYVYTFIEPYLRGVLTMHTLRYYLGDDVFFEVLKRWAYPDSTDFDNTNGRLCRLVDTDDLMYLTEDIAGKEMDNFFEAYFREQYMPQITVTQYPDSSVFKWYILHENNLEEISLDLNIPVKVNGLDFIVEMVDGEGILNISPNDNLEVNPQNKIITGETIIEDATKIRNLDCTFELTQNYPNPFDSYSTIKINNPKLQRIKIEIFNSLGTKVNTLVNKDLSPGEYYFKIDGRKLEKGMYFYTLIAHDFKKSKSFIVK